MCSWKPLCTLQISEKVSVKQTENLQYPLTRPTDAPINVGWGSKQTQFHGSLGKSAAQTPSTSLDHIGSSPDDDQAPRISWRGDGSFFVVSSLSPETPSTPRRRRTLRVYDREGALQSTSEPIAGLEHALSWRPSGNLIASTQRFGFEGGGAGKEGRHDVVFFERNGLRHGEFGLRVAGTKIRDNNWDYKVKDVNWSSDSKVLAVWIENQDNDVG
jgi:elongator complex protein 1